MGDGGGGHCLVLMEWRPFGWSVCLPLLIFPCTIKSTKIGHPGGPGKRAVKRLCVVVVSFVVYLCTCAFVVLDLVSSVVCLVC